MKHIFIKLTLLCVLLCGAATELWSMKAIVKREKEESFRFKNIRDGGTLWMKMEFADVSVVVWNRNEILLESTTVVEAESTELAQKGLDYYETVKHQEERQQDKSVYIISRQKAGKQKNLKNVKITCQCTLYIPQDKLFLQLSNSFGVLYMQDSYRCKKASIAVKHGSLHINELLSNEESRLQVFFGSLNIEKGNHIRLTTGHCDKVQIGTVKELMYDAEHCRDIRIRDAATNDLKLEFCEAKLDEYNQGTVYLDFSTLRVQEAREPVVLTHCKHSTLMCYALDKGLKGSCQHSNIHAVLSDAAAFEKFSVNGSHSNVKLEVPQNLNARYDLKSSFGQIKLNVSQAKGTAEEGDRSNNFITSRKGYIGKNAQAKAQISILCTHSNIIVTE